jgi:hypothetical protein
MILAVVLLSAVLDSSIPPSSVPLPSPKEQPSTQTAAKATEDMQVVEGIEATKTVQAVLEKARTALGGRQKLQGVTSLLIEGARADMAFTYRLSWPDRFRVTRSKWDFIVDGPSRYVQIPDVAEDTRARARKNTVNEFVTQGLTLLLRAPSVLKVRASLRPAEGAGMPVTVVFSTSGGFALLVELDTSNFAPVAYSYVGNLEEGVCDEPPVTATASRRVSFDEFQTVSGIRFPVLMTDTISTPDGRTFPASLRFSSIRVNEGVTAADFQK